MTRLRCGRRDRQTGFTLVEVMVALAIAALGLAAVVTIGAYAIDNARVFQDRALALYIGLNVVTEMRLASEMPEVRETSDSVEYADRDWIWVARVAETDVEFLRRVEVDVAYADTPDEIVRTIVGFVGRPSQINAANSVWQALEGEIR